MISLGGGKARLEMNMVLPMAVALKVLALVHEEPPIRPERATTAIEMDWTVMHNGAWLKNELDKPGRSQSGLARFMHMDASAINRLVNGTRELKAREIEEIQAYLAETGE